MKNQIYKTTDPIRPNITIFTDDYGNYARVDELPFRSSMVLEFMRSYPDIKIAEILDIYVKPKYRGKKIGSLLLQTIAANYKSRAILVLVGAHEEEYPKLDEKDIPNIVSNLLPFYEKNGFISVNDIFGSYINFEPMLYADNWYGKLIANEL